MFTCPFGLVSDNKESFQVKACTLRSTIDIAIHVLLLVLLTAHGLSQSNFSKVK